MRSLAEWTLRAVAMVSLVAALWRSTRPDVVRAYSRSVSPGRVTSEVKRAVATNDGISLSVRADSSLSRADRDALVAVRRAGIPVRWHGALPSLAIEAIRDREPVGGARVLIVGAPRRLALSDSAGVLETMRDPGSGTIKVGTLVGSVSARDGGFVAHAIPPNAAERRAVAVFGRAGWESKFVVSALSESGWEVRASMPAAPTVVVRDEGLMPIDTARYDVVIVLDSTSSDLAPAIARFVRQGGGLIAAGTALGVESFRSMAPAQAEARRPGRILLADDTVTTRELPMRPLTAVRADAVALDRDASGVTLVARRVGLGRVAAIAYDDMWRWRMLGGASGASAHRAWWSALAGSVAPARADSRPSGADAAPRAAMFDALGDPETTEPVSTSGPTDPLPVVLLALLAAALLVETGSRRFRGER